MIVVYFNMDGRKKTYQFTGEIPNILHTCRESRLEGLKFWKRAFDSKWAVNGVYFNSDLDSLRFYGTCWGQKEFFLRKIKASDLSRVTRVLMKTSELDLAHMFSGLKKVIHLGDNECEGFQCRLRPGGESATHTVAWFRRYNSDNTDACKMMEAEEKEFSTLKAIVMKDELGSRVAIHHRILCTHGVPDWQVRFLLS